MGSAIVLLKCHGDCKEEEVIFLFFIFLLMDEVISSWETWEVFMEDLFDILWLTLSFDYFS